MSKSLSALADNELLARLEDLRRREREVTIEILRHLNEVERRRLHLKLGYPSLFAYCTTHLRYSESAAGRRVQAARCVRQFPRVAAFLDRGDVNLSTLGLVANLLTEQNVDEFLERIRGKSQREVEEIACAFRPPMRLRDRVQRVNVPAPAAQAGAVQASPALPRTTASFTLPRAEMSLVNPVANSRSGSEKSPSAVRMVPKLHIQFLADDAFMRDYHQACALLSHKIPRPSFARRCSVLCSRISSRVGVQTKDRKGASGRSERSRPRRARVEAAATGPRFQ